MSDPNEHSVAVKAIVANGPGDIVWKDGVYQRASETCLGLSRKELTQLLSVYVRSGGDLKDDVPAVVEGRGGDPGLN